MNGGCTGPSWIVSQTSRITISFSRSDMFTFDANIETLGSRTFQVGLPDTRVLWNVACVCETSSPPPPPSSWVVCGTYHPSYPGSSVVGTTSAPRCVWAAHSADPPRLQAPHRAPSTAPSTAPTRPARTGRRDELALRPSHRTTVRRLLPRRTRTSTEDPRTRSSSSDSRSSSSSSSSRPGPWRSGAAGWASPGAGLSTDRCPWTCSQRGRLTGRPRTASPGESAQLHRRCSQSCTVI